MFAHVRARDRVSKSPRQGAWEQETIKSSSAVGQTRCIIVLEHSYVAQRHSDSPSLYLDQNKNVEYYLKYAS